MNPLLRAARPDRAGAQLAGRRRAERPSGVVLGSSRRDRRGRGWLARSRDRHALAALPAHRVAAPLSRPHPIGERRTTYAAARVELVASGCAIAPKGLLPRMLARLAAVFCPVRYTGRHADPALPATRGPLRRRHAVRRGGADAAAGAGAIEVCAAYTRYARREMRRHKAYCHAILRWLASVPTTSCLGGRHEVAGLEQECHSPIRALRNSQAGSRKRCVGSFSPQGTRQGCESTR